MLGPTFQTGGWGRPKLDLGGCVFYAPFSRPDMVARGGAIVSGAGTMAVTPLNLAVGANTVTALTAGTFIVTMPYGGTVASNAATITGSPVTVLAGVATIVTTGVTTGTFTVTPSNIVKSKDSTGHLCTFTGTTWGKTGRDLDGVANKIALPDSIFAALSSGTIMGWVQSDDTTTDIFICYVNANNYIALAKTAGPRMEARVKFNSIEKYQIFGTNSAFGTGWSHIVWTKTGSTHAMFLNGIAQTLTWNVDVDRSAYFSNLVGTPQKNELGTAYIEAQFDGKFGEFYVFNRAMSAVEAMHNFQSTKWRYV